LVTVGPAPVATILLPPIARGCIDASGAFVCGFSGTPTGNYFVGRPLYRGDGRDFFVFDLSVVTGPVFGASLTFSLTGLSYPGGNASETLNLFDFTGSIPSLLAQTGGFAAFSDLASGTIYGTRVYSAADINRSVTQAITAAGLSDMNAALGGSFAFGGAIANLTGGNPEKVFGASGNSTVSQLTLITADASVPEPASVAFISTGPLGLGIKRRRQLRLQSKD